MEHWTLKVEPYEPPPPPDYTNMTDIGEGWYIDGSDACEGYSITLVQKIYIDTHGVLGMRVDIKADGCIDICDYGLPQGSEPDYIHICEPEDFISTLRHIVKVGRVQFPDEEAWRRR